MFAQQFSSSFTDAISWLPAGDKLEEESIIAPLSTAAELRAETSTPLPVSDDETFSAALSSLDEGEFSIASPVPSMDEFARVAGIPPTGGLVAQPESVFWPNREPSLYSSSDEGSDDALFPRYASPFPVEQSMLSEAIASEGESDAETTDRYATPIPPMSISMPLQASTVLQPVPVRPAKRSAYVAGFALDERATASGDDSSDDDDESEESEYAPSRRSSTKRARTSTSKNASVATKSRSRPSRNATVTPVSAAPMKSGPTGFAKTRGVKPVVRERRAPRVPVEVTATTSATLPRDKLLHISSDDLSEFVRQLELVRELSADDRRELQRQRRLVKNRESAQLSRMRKKASIERLEGLIEKQLARMEDDRRATAAARAEIASLKAKLGRR